MIDLELDEDTQEFLRIDATHMWVFGTWNVQCAACHAHRGSEAGRRECPASSSR